MKVTVVLNGALSRYARPQTPGQWHGEVPRGARILDLLGLLGIPGGTAVMATVDGSLRKPETVLPPDARVLLFTPMSGG